MTVHKTLAAAKSLRQSDRSPISTYEQAVWRIVALREDPEITDFAYDVAVKLVADIYWRTDTVVRRDALVLSKQLGV